ncbi:MAG TPA: plastocyanin/azurin family copper-binding protein [Conexibacter sp.]|nr:plastocyanin/azurin family copper-binding protein [Conexibacter sp.]
MAVSISQVQRWSALAAAPLLVSLTLAACGGGSGDSTSTSSASSSGGGGSASAQTQSSETTSSGGGAALDISATESGGLGFSQRTLSASAGTVTIRLDNGSGNSLPHGIAIEGNGVDKDGATVQPGDTSTVTVKLRPGRYTFYCPVPGHEDQGMKGTLTVS